MDVLIAAICLASGIAVHCIGANFVRRLLDTEPDGRDQM
jgi:hypothetical protein